MKSNLKHVLKKLTLILLSILTLFLIITTIYLGIAMKDWKQLDLTKLENIEQSSIIFDYKDKRITNIYGQENRIKISLNDIPEHVRNAFIAVEDVRFYHHPGFDIKRIFGALIEDIKAGGFVQGASTITQQVIRNSHLSQQKVLNRKIQEIYLAYQLEKRYSKDQILQAYLNIIYFGKGAYGIEAASRLYFGKSAKELTVSEGALLAGIPKNPSRYSPLANREESLKRRNLVIDLMVKNKLLPYEEGQKAKKEDLKLNENIPQTYPHRFFMDMVLEEASKKLGIKEDHLLNQGYRIYTTLDIELQNYVEELLKTSDLFPKSPVTKASCQSTVVVLDSSTGEIRAIMGGRDHQEKVIRKGFNRATQSRRQPGSTIKPLLVYSPAIENFGYTPVTFIEDAPVTFGKYTPSNYGGRFRGWITLRHAVAESVNIPAVKVLYDIGLRNGIAFAQKLGISFSEEDLNNLSVALGGFHHGVSPIEIARAYTALADEGKYKEYTTIRRIEDPLGVPLYKFKPIKKQVMSEETAFIMSNILQSTVNWNTGTASRLKPLGLPIAAKTGTVQLPETEEFSGIRGSNDAWIVVYNPDYVITVWMGFDKTDSRNYLPQGVVGGSYPAEIAKGILQHLFNTIKPQAFEKPLNVVEVKLDGKSLLQRKKVLLASPLTPDKHILTEYFTRYTVPHEETDYWVVPNTPEDFSVSLSQEGLPIISFSTVESFAAYDIYRNEEGNPESIAVHRVQSGTTGTIQWTDTSVAPRRTYNYYIVPIHPEILVNDKPAEGTPTLPLSIIVPQADDPGTADDEVRPPQDNQGTLNEPIEENADDTPAIHIEID